MKRTGQSKARGDSGTEAGCGVVSASKREGQFVAVVLFGVGRQLGEEQRGKLLAVIRDASIPRGRTGRTMRGSFNVAEACCCIQEQRIAFVEEIGCDAVANFLSSWPMRSVKRELTEQERLV